MGRIVLIGDEPHLPYQRPPLSKKFMLGELPVERMALRAASFFEHHNVELRLGNRAVGIDTQSQSVSLADGSQLIYDHLLLSVGSRVRKLTCPGADLAGVRYVRTLDDVTGIRADLAAAKRLVIVGAGFIGLEVAATARQMNVEVVVLEMADRCLNRVTSPLVSAFYAKRHAQSGVRLLTGIQVAAIEGNGRVSSVRCTDGSSFDADIVVAGIGIVPNTDIADAAGIRCENGIVVDEYCRTSSSNVYSAGDCTNHPSNRYGYRVRLESVDNAVEQARVAAASICGKSHSHAHTPWFWSDQYDVKLQTAGLLQGHDVEVVRGDPESNQFSVWYCKANELLAMDAVNRPGEFILAKRWIAERKHVDAARLADPAQDLKSLA